MVNKGKESYKFRNDCQKKSGNFKIANGYRAEKRTGYNGAGGKV